MSRESRKVGALKNLRTILLVALFIAITFLVASCGNSASTETSGSGPNGAVDQYTLEETTELASDQLGGTYESAYAILKAADTGYLPFQIVQAINTGTIDEEGQIDGEDPERLAQDYLSFLGLVSVAYAADGPSQQDLQELFDTMSTEQTDSWLAWILGATAEGYSIQQVTDEIDRSVRSGNPEPQQLFGIPILMDEDGDIVEPEYDSDWPFVGRTLLEELNREGALPGDKMMEVLVIGLKNAGYSDSQIKEAIFTNSVCIASTERDGSAQLIPCVAADGEIVPPENKTDWAPTDIQIPNVSPDWAREITRADSTSVTVNPDGSRQYTLIPEFAGPRADKEITNFSVTLELKPHKGEIATNNPDVGYFEVHGKVMIEYTQTADENRLGSTDFEGDRWVLEAEVFPELDGIISAANFLTTNGSFDDRALTTENAGALFTRTKFNADGVKQHEESFGGHIAGQFNESLTILDNSFIGQENGPGLYGLEIGSE